MNQAQHRFFYIIIAVALVGAVGSTYLFILNQNQQNQLETLLQERNAVLTELNNKTSELNTASSSVAELSSELAELREDIEDLADDYRDERDRNEEFEDQIRELSGTLGDLDKLARIDEQLLAKYSKVFFLNENYMPEKLKEIPSKYILEGKKDQYFHANAYDHLEDMIKAAARDDIDLKVISAYRSFDEQNALKGQFTQVYGTGANTFSADQGFSEHQLGTTVDLTSQEIGGTFASFAETEEYEWLLENAWRYGFILSYPKENTFYIFEPWHWRFVGTDLARDLNRNDETFYTMEQREISKYLLNFFD
jgi:LAS superfamily LD-carboxypeptidase LdcB